MRGAQVVTLLASRFSSVCHHRRPTNIIGITSGYVVRTLDLRGRRPSIRRYHHLDNL